MAYECPADPHPCSKIDGRVVAADFPRRDLLRDPAADFVGLRTAVSLALVVIIVAEMFIGATDGMGHRIIDAQISYSLTDMYGSILVAGAMGYGLNLALLFLERSVIHWSGK